MQTGQRGNSPVSAALHHYFASLLIPPRIPEIVVEGYTSYRASTFCSFVTGEKVTLHRTKPSISSDKKAVKKGKEDTIVRFKNSKDIEVGRVVEREAEWISRLLDLDMASFEGVAIDVPVKFSAGQSLHHVMNPTTSCG